MSMAAGFGVQLWPILQDLSQLSGLYPQTRETFYQMPFGCFLGRAMKKPQTT
jgi:type IV secretory pathway TraG/TraD family ATPase VirD4